MADLSSHEAQLPSVNDEFDRFRKIRLLTNHWARPIGPASYYWFLTFDRSSEIQSLAHMCQEAITFPYYDLTPAADLHMTLDRIAYEGDISQHKLQAIADATVTHCHTIPPLEITIGRLGGTTGAIGFAAYPRQPIESLRDGLRAVTLATHPAARVRSTSLHPHVTIAYCNSDGVDAADAIAAVEALTDNVSATLTVGSVSLVRLTRLPQAYRWKTVSQIPLLGDS